MSTQTTHGRSVWSGLALIAIGAWLIVAPLAFGRDETADWTSSPLVALGLAGSAVVVAGALMVVPARRCARWGGLLAFAAGLALVFVAAVALLWTAGAVPADDVGLGVWLGFFVQAGVLVAALAMYALGWLDSGWAAARRAGPGGHPPCESRRRRLNASPLRAAREGRHGAARRRGRPDGNART